MPQQKQLTVVEQSKTRLRLAIQIQRATIIDLSARVLRPITLVDRVVVFAKRAGSVLLSLFPATPLSNGSASAPRNRRSPEIGRDKNSS